jgi:hypothetical protein
MFDNFLTHTVSADLEAQLLREMGSRGAVLRPSRPELENPRAVTDYCIDFGGGAYVHRPMEEFTWAGLEMAIPSDQVAGAIRVINGLPLRRFADGRPYLKLKHWHFALVMTPTQHVELCARLAGIADAAERRAEAFEAALERGLRMGVS